MKNKFTVIGIIITTIILAGVAIFTAMRLYQTREVAVAPNVPSSKPKAQEIPNTCNLSFTLTAATSTPTATATATSTTTAISTATATATATNTTTATSTATTVATTTAKGTTVAAATPTEPSLPVVGTTWPTLLGTGFGVLVIIGSLLLAL